MGGMAFAGVSAGMIGTPFIRGYLLAGGSAGGVNISQGDVVVLTTKSTLTSGGVVVVRTMLAADKTAHYKEGIPVAGLLGIATCDASSNSSGTPTSPSALGGVASGGQVVYPYGYPGTIGLDPLTNRGYLPVMVFAPGYIFKGQLNSGNASSALTNTLGGLILTSGTFTIDTGAAAADQCLEIIGPDTSDPNYAAGTGTSVLWRMLDSFSQYLTGVSYSTQ